MLANLDNLGATLDAAVVGWHLAHDADAVVRGGGRRRRSRRLARALERPARDPRGLPPAAGFDPCHAGVFNTNTFHADARALLTHDGEWTWFGSRRRSTAAPAIQRERLLGELTSHLATRFVQVPRDGPGSRFLPAKDFDELAARQPELRARP